MRDAKWVCMDASDFSFFLHSSFLTKTQVFWGITPCRQINSYARFGTAWPSISRYHVRQQLRKILCSDDRAFLYNLVNETNLVHCFFLVYFVNFVYNPYMFRTSQSLSSGRTTVFMRYLVLVILYSWLVCRSICSCMPESQWTWRRPKYVEVINNIDKIH